MFVACGMEAHERKKPGRKAKAAKDKKQPLAFQIKYGLHAIARERIQPIVDEINAGVVQSALANIETKGGPY